VFWEREIERGLGVKRGFIPARGKKDRWEPEHGLKRK